MTADPNVPTAAAASAARAARARRHNAPAPTFPDAFGTPGAHAALAVALLLALGAPKEPSMHDFADWSAIPVLMYHHVGDWGPSRPDWAPWVVLPADFRAQMDWLVRSGYHSATFAQLEARARQGMPPPPRTVVLSFDDGWAAQEAVARDELEPRGLQGVLFVYTGAIGREPNGGGYLSWPQLRTMESRGHEVQSHTVGHPRLTGVDDAALARELRESRARIAQELGHESTVLAYPYGDHDDRVAAAARDAGYARAYRADAAPESGGAGLGAYRLPRISVGYGEPLPVFIERVRAAEGAR
ncbi:MAG: polysaccharide deacetylase family protein [Phycisphaerales bacterium]